MAAQLAMIVRMVSPGGAAANSGVARGDMGHPAAIRAACAPSPTTRPRRVYDPALNVFRPPLLRGGRESRIESLEVDSKPARFAN